MRLNFLSVQLALVLFMKGDLVLLHQRQKVARREAGQRRLCKARVLAQEIGGADVGVGEVGPAAARDADFLGDFFAVVQQQNLQTALPGLARAKQAGRPGAHDHDIKTVHGLQCRLAANDDSTRQEVLHYERDKPMNPILFAIPVFLLTIVLEAWWARRRGLAVYDIPDAV